MIIQKMLSDEVVHRNQMKYERRQEKGMLIDEAEEESSVMISVK